MRRFAPALFLSLTIFALLLAGCGGGNKGPDPTTQIAKIIASPDPVSLNRGTYTTVTPTAQNSKDATVAATFSFSSDNAELASVTTRGEICAGKWNDAFTICSPAATSGVANITISATNTSVTKVLKVYVHEKVDSVNIVGQAPGECISALNKQTVQLSATAFSNSSAICGGAAPCALPADTIGKFTWSVNGLDSNVASVDDTIEKQGLVTAAVPGRAFISASIAGVVSPPSAVTVCPVVSIEASIKDSTASSFTADKAATKTLNAVVKDSGGNTLTTGPFVWLSTASPAITVAAGSTGLTATATANQPGTAALIATCTPPSCNKNLFPVYSNIITGTTNGTSTGTVYVASTQSTSLVPIPIGTGTPGTAITLARAPNSFLMNRQGTKAILGADSGGSMILDTAAGTVGTLSNISGKPLAFSPNGTMVIISNASARIVYIYDISTSALTTSFAVPVGATGAAFNVEGTVAYIAAGSNLYVWNVGLGSTVQTGARQIVVPSALRDAATPTQGDSAYLSTAAGVDVRAACNLQTVDTLASTNPTLIRAIPNGSGLLALNSPNIDVISVTGTGVGCPLPTPTETINSHDLGLGSFSPKQLLISSDSSKAYVLSDQTSIAVYDLSSTAVTTLAPSGTPVLGQADLTLDGKLLYMVGADSKVHKFDTATATEATPIAVTLKKEDKTTAAVPDLLQVRSQ